MRRRVLSARLFSLAGLASVLLTACPPLSPDDSTDAGPPGEDPVVAQVAAAYDVFLDNCDIGGGPGGSAFLEQVEPNGGDDPTTAALRQQIRTVLQNMLENPNIDVDATQLDGCVAELESPEACQGGPGEACQALFVGHITLGDVCGTDLECESGYCEQTDYQSGCGRCADAPTEVSPDPVPPTDPTQDPAPGGGGAGAPQAPTCLNQGCPEGEYCHFNDVTFEATCLAYLPAGNTCIIDNTDSTEVFECEAALYCDEGTRQCTALPAEGESCLNASRCADGFLCDLNAGVCATAPQAGQPCLNGVCGVAAICDVSVDTCVVPPGDSEPCVQGVCADGLFCFYAQNGGNARPAQPQPGPDAPDVAPRPQGEGGICTTYVEGNAAGDRCLPGYGCGGGTLESGLACVGALGSAVCVEAVVVADGEPCNTQGENDQDASRFCLNGLSTQYCDINPGDESGVCTVRPAPQEPCDDLTPCGRGDALCLPVDFTNFDAGQQCVPFQQEGDPCRPEEINAAFEFTLCAPLLRCGPGGTCQSEGTLDAEQCSEIDVPQSGGGQTGGGSVQPGGTGGGSGDGPPPPAP